MDHDPTRDARRLAQPASGRAALSRRRFLQAALVAGGAGAIDGVPFLGRTSAAWAGTVPGDRSGAASAAGSGALVLVNLQGGNDALNTVVPYGVGAYHDRRGPLALSTADLHVLDAQVGLHPALSFLASRWAAGRLAIVEGIGDPSPDLSHFTSMARWMSGRAETAPRTGWLGRYLDQLDTPSDGFDAVTIGGDVPLTVVGARRAAVALATAAVGFGTSKDPTDVRLARGVRDLAATPTGRGPLADAVAAVGRQMVDVSALAAPLYHPDLTGDAPVPDLELAARLLNAGLGVRVVNVTVPGFDTHTTQLGYHTQLLARLDAGLARFFATLDPTIAGRVAVLVVSEFGRSVEPNGSAGTDHGTAGVALLVGDGVRGGRHGALPSFADRDGWGQLRPTVDHRSLFATVLGRWLGADDTAILGARYEPLDLFAAPPLGDVPARAPAVADQGFLEAVRPVRVLDTRVDGGGGAPAKVPAGGTVRLALVGAGRTAPPGTSSVVLNVTATEPTAAAYVTVWPTGQARPLASNLNITPGRTVPNLVVAAVGDDGSVSLYNSAGSTHLVVDLVGYAGTTPGGTFVPVAPFRLLDTRTGTDASALVAGVPRRVPVAGVGGVPDHGVLGVVANVTVTAPTSDGYLTVYPSEGAVPLASNLNVVAGETVPNLVLARLGGGAIDIVTSASSAHVVVDVVGIVSSGTTGARLATGTPTRLLDTRNGTGGGHRLGPGASLELLVAGTAGVPAEATAVVLNLAAVDPTTAGYVTAWPAGRERPTTSNLNLTPGRTVANLAVVGVGDGGAVWFHNAVGSVDLVADVVGWFV